MAAAPRRPGRGARPAFRRHVTTAAVFVARKPERLTRAAAALPIACMTASALSDLGRLAAGERVLIHSAAGGVGLAAVQRAQRIGAEVFATAGNEEKRAFLRSIGVRHVMDSRSFAYVDEILAHTGGSGVDVVLNSLTGDAIAHSLSVLAPYGRFLEIGKRDIYQNRQIGLAPFRKNLSYFAVDLARMIERPNGSRRCSPRRCRMRARGTRPLAIASPGRQGRGRVSRYGPGEAHRQDVLRSAIPCCRARSGTSAAVKDDATCMVREGSAVLA